MRHLLSRIRETLRAVLLMTVARLMGYDGAELVQDVRETTPPGAEWATFEKDGRPYVKSPYKVKQ
jgi:hypothetical protein